MPRQSGLPSGKSARDLQGEELLEKRFSGKLLVSFTDNRNGQELVRSVQIDEVWDDKEYFNNYLTGLGDEVLDALQFRLEKGEAWMNARGLKQ